MKIILRALAVVMVAASMTQATRAEMAGALPPGDGHYTDVRIEGNVVTVVVPLAVVYATEASADPPDPASVSFVQNGFAAGAAFWNAGFARLAGCFELRLQVDVAFTTDEGSGAPELDRYHIVHPYNQWRAGEFPDGRGLPTVVFPGIPPGDLAGDVDITYPFDQFTVGYLPEWLFEDPWALAHELGHFFGLGDDYRDGVIIPGREGTLMGGTEGGDYIDQAVIDDVTKLIDEAGYDLPQCITGRFLLEDESHSVSEFQDTDTDYDLTVTFSLTTQADGTLDGEGEAEFHTYTHDVTKSDIPDNRCESFLGPVDEKWPVKLEGRFTGDVLSFEVDPSSKTVMADVSGSCGTDTIPIVVASFVGWADITFADGVYEYKSDTPHQAPDTGSTHLELTLEQQPRD